MSIQEVFFALDLMLHQAPEFVRKHLFNKHAAHVKEVRVETNYFNNYLR